MANTVAFSRGLLVYAVCLPLAIIVGYMLADLDSGAVSVLVLLLAVLALPVLMRWHHLLLVFSCNAVISFMALPGSPDMWMLMTAISLFFSVLNRSVGRDVRFFQAPSVVFSLLFLGLVVLVTARLTGGIGLRSLGASTYGGKKYFSLFAGIALFFALSTPHIPRHRAGLYVALFFGSMFTGLVSYVAAALSSVLGPVAFYLVEFFPIQGGVQEVMGGTGPAGSPIEGFTRLGTLAYVSTALTAIVLARYGMRGALDVNRPWRLLVLVFAVAAALASGFRSNVLLLGTLFGLMFYFEGLLRTRYFYILLLLGLLGAAIALPNVQKLPISMQRAVAFLPLDVSPVARRSAEDSTTWRLEMWQELLPQVPRYLLRGKGYALNPDDLYMVGIASYAGYTLGSEGSALAGDYHSGPLSLVIPFGIFGVIGFVWFLSASVKVLRQNRRYGDPALYRINNFLYTYFVAKIIMFVFVFGAFNSDLAMFAGLVGLSLSLNGGVVKAPEPSSEEEAAAGELSDSFAGI